MSAFVSIYLSIGCALYLLSEIKTSPTRYAYQRAIGPGCEPWLARVLAVICITGIIILWPLSVAVVAIKVVRELRGAA